jgi:hypothetical protein
MAKDSKPKKAKTRQNEPGRPEGRPEKPIEAPSGDELIVQLASLMCTDAEIAAVCGVSRSTIARRKRTRPFRELIDRGRDHGKASLRRWQMEAAKRGNVTAQIWLGKQYLGQKDNVTHDYGNPAGIAGAFESALDRVFARLDRHAAAASAGSVQGT